MKSAKVFFILNLFFIFIFLNIWDYVSSRDIFNGMIIGIFMFGPTAILWGIGKTGAIALLTLISIIEFVMMAIIVVEGLEFGGFVITAKSLFWAPYLLVAGINGFWGLKIYSEHREGKLKKKNKEKKK